MNSRNATGVLAGVPPAGRDVPGQRAALIRFFSCSTHKAVAETFKTTYFIVG